MTETASFESKKWTLSKTSKRWVCLIITRENASILITDDDEFLITKQPLPSIAHAGATRTRFKAGLSPECYIEDNAFISAFASFLLVEICPIMSPVDSASLPIEFLDDFDDVLSTCVQNSNSQVLSLYNHRCLKNRLITSNIPKEQLALLSSRSKEKYRSLIQTFQA
jgi:hypothetical protein